MAFEKRFSLLISKAHEDYNDMVRSANFLDGDVEELSLKITVSKAVLDYMTTSLSESPSDVEALLFYERPVTAVCEQFLENEVSLWNGLMEPFDHFVQDTKHHIKEVFQQWESVPLDEVEKAQVFLSMEQEIAKQSEQLQQELMERSGLQVEYHGNIERDFADCVEYLKRYEDIHGTQNTAFETTIKALHSRMLEFDGLTTEQLRAISKLDDPLTAVYRCFTGIVQGDPNCNEQLDIAITGTAKAQISIAAHNEQRVQEQDNDLER